MYEYGSSWGQNPTGTDRAQESLDRAKDEVSEDRIAAILTDEEKSVAHEWLANSADLIGRMLKNPVIRLAMSRADLKALDTLSEIADSVFEEREAAITQCAETALSGDRQDAIDARAESLADAA